MNQKYYKYTKKTNKILKIVKLVGIFIVFLAFFVLKAQYFIKKNKITDMVLKEEYKNSGAGTTYYISSNGVSTDGTDINNPMSLETANTKKYKGNDKVLLKKGDTFYGQINFNVTAISDSFFFIGNYGNGDIPKVSGAKIINKEEAWQKLDSYDNIYVVDLSNIENFEGVTWTDADSCNIGFLEDDNRNKYYNRKKELSMVQREYEFYCKDKKLYFKCNKNPYTKLGSLKLVTKKHLVYLCNNTELDGIKVEYTGGHGIVKKSYPIRNVYIHDCIVENIGGSVQIEDRFIRYGNGIEFWLGAKNIQVENNIIRNCYDAGFTIQGNSGQWQNIIVRNNILIQNCYSFELWGSSNSTGMYNVHICGNICINEGKRMGTERKT